MYTSTATPVAGTDYAYYDSALTSPETITNVSSDSITVLSVGDCTRSPSDDILPTYSKATQQTETIGSYTITYYLTSDGHKITVPSQEYIVQNIYNESGVAWYYILDVEHTRFKLPRTKFGFTGLRDTVGKYVPAGLPNITGRTSFLLANENSASSGALSTSVDVYSGVQGSGGSSVPRSLNLNASSSSSIYGNSDTVQPPATQMYLYFYVGDTIRTETEIDIGELTEALNDKLDTNLNNATSNTKQIIVGWGSPDYSATLSGVGNNYTAPSDGIFWFAIGNNNNSRSIGIIPNGSSQVVFTNVINSYGTSGGYQVVLAKGDKIIITDASTALSYSYFIPLKGVNNA